MKNLARKRLLEIGLPLPRNDDWMYFPVSKLSSLEIPAVENSSVENKNALGIETESNAAALLPIAFGAYSKITTIAPNETEHGILKNRDEFSHSIFKVSTGAKLYLEILGNKSERKISCERIDLELETDAEVFLFFHEQISEETTHLTHIRITLAQNAKLHSNMLFTGKGISRTSSEIFLNGSSSFADYRSLAILTDKASEHSHLKIHHNARETKSTQFARHFLSNSSYASYDGSVLAGENCPQVNSSQLINTILQDNAKVSVKPNLKIYHDEVECSHGCTCGSFDEEELFYLQSRGLTEEKAKKILTRSFAREVFPDSLPYSKRISEELSKLGF
ncbi:MAG: SufD family Fe-S cluster assembly protein [Fibrobacteraceae bacterium]|nr:SufD family Fe-S cluster assembly protein [Fibrobacteraceae bacterium]